jgi:hypothetical protein
MQYRTGLRTMRQSTRRSFLKFTTGSAAASLIQTRGICAPAIIQTELTPQQFGAKGGDPVADTLGWNRVVAEGARTGRPVIARGTYVLHVPAEAAWTRTRHPKGDVHIAVQLGSGVHIEGVNAEIVVGRPDFSPDATQWHFLFGTGLRPKPGAYRDISLQGLVFDFRDEFGAVHPNTYATGVTGIDHLRRSDLTFRSSSARVGRGLYCENSRNRLENNLTHQNIVQGIYTRHEHGVQMRHVTFDGFVEAMDFDGPCWDVMLSDLNFRNGVHEAQCIDTAGGARWVVQNIVAERVGNIIDFYVKPDAWPDYASWLTGEPAPAPVPPSDMTVRNVRGTEVGKMGGKEAAALRVGAARNKHWQKQFPPNTPGPSRIAIENWSLDNLSQIVVNDCRELSMRRITLRHGESPANGPAGAALLIEESPEPYPTTITGEIADANILDSAGVGLSATAGPELSLTHIRTGGSNHAGATNGTPAIVIRPEIGTAGPRAIDVKGT